MKEQFLDYNNSLRLKNLGFDERCLMGHSKSKGDYWYRENTSDYPQTNSHYVKYSYPEYEHCTLPLIQQVIDWLDSKGLYINVGILSTMEWTVYIADSTKVLMDCYKNNKSFNTRKEATLEGIEMCLSILENNPE
ncbi:MAG: hypothetical protein ACRCXN_10775 [Bacteroidales bacterium]